MEFIDLKTQYIKYKNEIDQEIQGVLDSAQFIMGPQVTAAEEELADYVGVKHCISASSGTDTLILALLALGVGPGDEVITTPFTFIATVEVIALLGAKPVFVDIDRNTYNIDPSLIEKAITPKTKAIMPVGLFGQMPDVEAINAIAKRHYLPVIEDGAQSFGATQNGKMSCGATTIGSTSFFPAKPLGCYGDGGALFTDDDELAKKIKILRVHGGAERHTYTDIGINGRFDAIQAAVIRVKLRHYPEEVKKRQEIGKRYSDLLQECCKTPYIQEGFTSTYSIYTIEVPNRDEIAAELQSKGIPTSVYYPFPCFSQPAYAYLSVDPNLFPNTLDACRNVLALPMHPWLDEETQNDIVEAVQSTCKAGVSR